MFPIKHYELPNLLAANTLLKPLSPDQVSDDYVSWLNDEATNRFLESRFCINTKDSVRRFLECQITSGLVLFYGIWSFDDRHIGNIKLGPIDLQHLSADIGFIVGNRAYWGKGIATDAINLLTKYAFSLGVEKITAGAYETNKGSIRVLEKCGFQKEGYRASQVCYQGKRIGTYLFGLQC